jgi:8-amino-7-oxononanoate synthase
MRIVVNLMMSHTNSPDPFRHLDCGTSRKFSVLSEDYLFFSGTDYLGISQNDDFKSLYIQGIEKWGFNNGTSRNNNVQLNIYPEAEKLIAANYHAPAALVTSSGYLAAQLVVQSFFSEKNILFSPLTHPAIWLNSKPSVEITSFESWKRDTIHHINTSPEEKFIIVSNAVDPQQPALLHFEDFSTIDPSKQVTLIIDDSHGIGFTRNEGKGVYQTLPQQKNITNIVVASMAKGLGIRAGLVLSDEATIDQLRKSGMFIGASPAAPASMYAYVEAQHIYRHAYQTLQINNQYFREKLTQPFSCVEELPIYVSANEQLFGQLKQQKILISSFAYPSASDPLLNRIIINAAHQKEDIDQLLKALTIQ